MLLQTESGQYFCKYNPLLPSLPLTSLIIWTLEVATGPLPFFLKKLAIRSDQIRAMQHDHAQGHSNLQIDQRIMSKGSRLDDLRQLMRKERVPLAAYVILTDDAHQVWRWGVLCNSEINFFLFRVNI